MAFDRDRSIIAQNAGSSAAVLYAAELNNTGGTFEPERYAEIREFVLQGSLDEAYHAQPVQGDPSPAEAVAAQFPGATVIPNEPFPPAPVVGSIPAAPQPGQLPQPGQQLQPGTSKTDAKWLAFFQDPSAYYDNRNDKAQRAAQGQPTNGPDFKHKQSGDGLWLGGKYPAPNWVLQRLGIA